MSSEGADGLDIGHEDLDTSTNLAVDPSTEAGGEGAAKPSEEVPAADSVPTLKLGKLTL